MEEQIEVLVGTGIGGQRNILDAIGKQGFKTKHVGCLWPRDQYVYFNGNYIFRGEGSNENHFGEGGYFRFGNDYVLIGGGLIDLVTKYKFRDILGMEGNSKKEEATVGLIQETKKHFDGFSIHVVPTGGFRGRGHNHLDMSVLLLPKKRILIVDTYFNHFASTGTEIDQIGEREKLKVIRYDGSQDEVWYPLNSLVLDKNGNDLVFIDSKADSLKRLLERENVAFVDIEMPQHQHPSGKINCQTNIYRKFEDIVARL